MMTEDEVREGVALAQAIRRDWAPPKDAIRAARSARICSGDASDLEALRAFWGCIQAVEKTGDAGVPPSSGPFGRQAAHGYAERTGRDVADCIASVRVSRIRRRTFAFIPPEGAR